MIVLHSVQYLPTPVVDTLLYTSWSFGLIKRQRWPLNCKSMILKKAWPSFCLKSLCKSNDQKLHEKTCNQVIIFFFCWAKMLIPVANASMGKKQVTILTSYLHSLTTLFHFEWLNSIFPCAHTGTDLDRGAGGWATAGERAAAETQWFTTIPATPATLHQDVDVGMECVQEDTGVHFWVGISNMAYSDVLLAVDCDSVPAWDQGYGIVY